MSEPERWQLSYSGLDHVVEIVDSGLGHRITWGVDGTEVDSRKTSDEKVVLDGGVHGAIGVRLPTFTGPARRVTWWGPDSEPGAVAAAHTRLGGVDLDPEEGSKAAVREAWIREHPRQFALRRTAAATAGIVVPLLLIWLLGRYALPAIPWPDWDLPDIPWPTVPWPNIAFPSIPWPDVPWPDWSLPGWVRTVLGYAKYVWPVALAVVLARGELRRRRQQDERKRAAKEESADAIPDQRPDVSRP